MGHSVYLLPSTIMLDNVLAAFAEADFYQWEQRFHKGWFTLLLSINHIPYSYSSTLADQSARVRIVTDDTNDPLAISHGLDHVANHQYICLIVVQ